MTKEDFINKIKEIKVNVPDEEFFLEYNKIIYDVLDREEKLIKYLENKIHVLKNKGASYGLTIDYDIAEYIDNKIEAYQEILEKVKSGKYE